MFSDHSFKKNGTTFFSWVMRTLRKHSSNIMGMLDKSPHCKKCWFNLKKNLSSLKWKK